MCIRRYSLGNAYPQYHCYFGFSITSKYNLPTLLFFSNIYYFATIDKSIPKLESLYQFRNSLSMWMSLSQWGARPFIFLFIILS